MPATFDWSDLRYFLAVARHGSTRAAARTLGVDASTVHRRISELERRLGHKLIRRHAAGYRLTEFGASVVPLAEDVAEAVAAVERHASAYGGDLVGTVRLTCPEPLVTRITNSELLDRFRERHPGLRIEFVMSDSYLDLGRGEADVALRSGDPADPNLVGRKIGDSIWAVYASEAYVARRGRPSGVEELAGHALVGFDGMLSEHRAARWLAAVAPNAEFATHNNSVLGVLHAVRSGIGLAPLPTTLGDAEDGLVQVLPPVPELTRGWYLLTHPDLRDTPRIRAFIDFVAERLDLVRPILMG